MPGPGLCCPTVTVLGCFGVPIAGATVTITLAGETEPFFSGTTDSAGKLKIPYCRGSGETLDISAGPRYVGVSLRRDAGSALSFLVQLEADDCYVCCIIDNIKMPIARTLSYTDSQVSAGVTYGSWSQIGPGGESIVHGWKLCYTATTAHLLDSVTSVTSGACFDNTTVKTKTGTAPVVIAGTCGFISQYAIVCGGPEICPGTGGPGSIGWGPGAAIVSPTLDVSLCNQFTDLPQMGGTGQLFNFAPQTNDIANAGVTIFGGTGITFIVPPDPLSGTAWSYTGTWGSDVNGNAPAVSGSFTVTEGPCGGSGSGGGGGGGGGALPGSITLTPDSSAIWGAVAGVAITLNYDSTAGDYD